jgi:transposase
MAKPLLPDALWSVTEPLLPAERAKPKSGRPPLSHRTALTGILFLLKSGIPWEMLPREMGCGSGMTCWHRSRDWQAACIWNRLHCVLLDRLGGAHAIDWNRACVDSASVPAKKGAIKTDHNPTDRGRAGSKRHIITDAQGVPLAVRITAANIPHSRLFDELIDAVPPVSRVAAGLAAAREIPCRLGDRIARRRIETSERLEHHRWVVERTLAWFSRFRLTIRHERRVDIFEAFHHLAAALICWRFIQRQFCEAL